VGDWVCVEGVCGGSRPGGAWARRSLVVVVEVEVVVVVGGQPR
jgi:hypothetical protein